MSQKVSVHVYRGLVEFGTLLSQTFLPILYCYVDTPLRVLEKKVHRYHISTTEDIYNK